MLNDISVGTANYQAGQFTLERRFAHGLQFQANYTYSHTIDESSAASLAFNSSVDNPLCIPCNRGNSALDVPQRFVANFLYESPALRGWNKGVQALLGSWEISGIYQAQSGPAFTIYAGVDTAFTGDFGEHASLATGNSTIHVHPGSLTNYLTASDFTFPDPGSFGTVGRNTVFGPGVNTWDINLSKNFHFGERYRLQFRWEMFNAFNRPTFFLPDNYLSDGSSFGQVFQYKSELLTARDAGGAEVLFLKVQPNQNVITRWG